LLEENIQRLIRRDPQLDSAVQYTQRVLTDLAHSKELKHWIVTYSGGKDSTLVTILALEMLYELAPQGVKLEVVYSDTLLEIPALRENAVAFLKQVDETAQKRELPVSVHSVAPPLQDRFWVLLIGKGYPSPKRYFRWCTERLKIKPVEAIMARLDKPMAVLTGMRLGESNARNARMKATCSRDGECGHDLWLNRKADGVYYLAPIVHWTTCRVWDFLTLFAPLLGWKTDELVNLYNGDSVRFGCWTCTLIEEDRALKAVMQIPRWGHLGPLNELRLFLDEGRDLDNRQMRDDGKPGKMKIEFRRVLLNEVLKAQDKVGLDLISEEEILSIHELWEKEGNKVHGQS